MYIPAVDTANRNRYKLGLALAVRGVLQYDGGVLTNASALQSVAARKARARKWRNMALLLDAAATLWLLRELLR